MSTEKRPIDSETSEPENAEGDGWIGPMPSEAAKPKAKKRRGYIFVFFRIIQ